MNSGIKADSGSNLNPAGNSVFFKSVFIACVAGTLLVMGTAGMVFWHFSRGLPKIITVADYRPLAVTRILGGGGKEDAEIGEFYKERRYLIPYDKIPDIVVRAFISAEDDRFFEHPGINIVSIIRAGIANFKAGHVVQGGSTITQQVAKSLLLTPERSFDRKIKEVILSTRIERNLTKQQILYLYLNQIYLGHGSYGVQAACKTYFNKDISRITIAEAAVLAGLPQAPGKYSPLLNPKKAKERQLYVLKRLYENKYITQAQMLEAASQPVKVFTDEGTGLDYGKYYAEFLRKYLVEKYGEKQVYEDGLTINVATTPELLKVSARSLREGLLAVDKRIGYRGPVQHLKTSDEIEKYLRELRVKMIRKRVPYELLLPDGRLDPVEAMHHAGIQVDADLLDPSEVYQAVVTGFDPKGKVARVMLGAVKAELPISEMRWAHPVRDEANPNASLAPPSSVTRVFTRGDVILVRVASNTKKEIKVALEQEPLVQGALISLEAQTGYVLAMEGGFDFEQSEFNRAVQALRQPGSSFKPIIYSSALEKGYTPASVIVDSPLIFKEGEGTWKPGNFEEKFYGDTTFRQALIKSSNIPTIKIVQSVGIPYVIEYAKRIGINAQFPSDLSISLGSAVLSPMELTRTYALFPRLGRKVTPVFLQKVIDRDGKVLEELKPQLLPPEVKIPPTPQDTKAGVTPIAAQNGSPTPSSPTTNFQIQGVKSNLVMPKYPPADDPDQVLDPRVAYVMTHLMKEVVNYGTGHEAKNLGRPAAGKTGTTNDYIDAWFMGFTPSVVTGVWVGFDSQKSIGHSETGARAALPIWLSFMKEATKNYPDMDFTVPPGVVFASINAATGKPAPANSSQAIKEAFIESTEPTDAPDANGSGSDSQSDFFKEDTQ